MGNIVGKQFRVVASKDLTTAIAESVKDGNQAKFYLAQRNTGKALNDVTKTTDDDRNTLVVNGNLIQGVSHNDFAKLDAITDVTKIFKYKGTVYTKEELFEKEHDPSTKKGDVWNVECQCTINGITYPAYTNFVYIDTTNNSEINWDSLGGTMQIGTAAVPTVENSVLRYKTVDMVPACYFEIVLGSDTGLIADTDGVIRIKSDKKKFSSIGNGSGTLSCNSASPLNDITLHISTYNGLFIGSDNSGNDCIDLHLSTRITCYVSTSDISCNPSLLAVSYNSYPLHNFLLPCGDGVEAIAADNYSNARLAVKLSTYGTDIEVAGNSRMSGLDFCDGGLYIALSSSEGVNEKFLIRNSNGLALKYTELVNSLMSNVKLKQYINSLIEAKLQAQ